MDNVKGWIAGTIITLVIGGTAYTFNQEDVVKNFADETGMTQEQAEQYINTIPEDELDTFTVIGTSFITDGTAMRTEVQNIDCEKNEYEWQSEILTCAMGKRQLTKIADDMIAFGHVFQKLDTDEATEQDIQEAIRLIDQMVRNNRLAVSKAIWTQEELDEENRGHAYNKALLQAALDSVQ